MPEVHIKILHLTKNYLYIKLLGEVIKVNMEKVQRLIIRILLMFMLMAVTLQAATVRGYVRNYNRNAPIREALVAIESQKGTKYSAQTLTDIEGYFVIKDVPQGV